MGGVGDHCPRERKNQTEISEPEVMMHFCRTIDFFFIVIIFVFPKKLQ